MLEEKKITGGAEAGYNMGVFHTLWRVWSENEARSVDWGQIM